MAHCMPLLVRPRSAWILGAAIETIVWSMKVMATAKIIAVRISGLDRPPVVVVPTALILFSRAGVLTGRSQDGLARGRGSSVKRLPAAAS